MQLVDLRPFVKIELGQDIYFKTPVNILEAIHKGLVTLQRIREPGKIKSEYFDRARERLNNFVPSTRKALAAPIYPIKYASSHIRHSIYENKQDKAKRIKRELLDAGITFYGLLKSESRILPKILHPNEHIEAVVYGLHHSHSVMLIATNERITYLDKKPMALFLDEVSYEVVSGIEFEIHTFFATLVLHTPVKNYDIRFANLHCAENFARHIENKRLARERSEEEHQVDVVLPKAQKQMPRQAYHIDDFKDLAGYYLLPVEEKEE